MARGAPEEARWFRPAPRSELPVKRLARFVQSTLPHARILEAEPLSDGLRNVNFKLRIDARPEFLVLRVYEHHPSIAQKELDLLQLVSGSVPVPEVIHAEPGGVDDLPPFLLTRYVEGITFRDLLHTQDSDAIAQAARSVGETLAAIGLFAFSKPGWLGPGPAVGAPLLEGADPGPRFVDRCLESALLQRRVPAEMRGRVQALSWAESVRLGPLLDESKLVHGDFSKRNLVVVPDHAKWVVSGVLDWEFAVSGSPLADVGSFLRYEDSQKPTLEPYFSEGFLGAGGQLPQEWRRLARLVDLLALCESLTHDALPEPVVTELVSLLRKTVEKPDLW